MNEFQSGVADAAILSSRPEMGGTAPVAIRLSMYSSLKTPCVSQSVAVAFAESLALEATEKNVDRLPVTSDGSPSPPSTVGNVVQPSLPESTKSLAAVW